jgi:acetyl-CoA C-acetyltransferase
MPEAVVVATARSPIGRAFKGSLTEVRPDDLAATVIQAALKKVPQLSASDVDDLLLGCAAPSGEQGFNMARVVAVLLGYDHVPGTTVTRECASSLQTTAMAFHAIRSGEGDVFISAGVEMVSRQPTAATDAEYDPRNPRFDEARRCSKAIEAGASTWLDPRERGLLPDIYVGMGQTAENVADMCGVTRTEQDELGCRSQNLAEQAISSGFFEREITAITLPDGSVVNRDDSPRPGTIMEKLAALRPAFRPDGSVTAGNCCPLSDGAAAVIVMSDTKAREFGIPPLARVVASAVSALSPEIMGLGPVDATRRVLARAGMTIRDIDVVEVNEAFAAQVIPCVRQLEIDVDRQLNLQGGAIALGHPFGMTGARITTTLINSLRWRDKQYGLETMCVGGGQGMAMVFERLN